MTLPFPSRFTGSQGGAVAYLANLLPADTELYVVDEIAELRRRGVQVVPCSVRCPRPFPPDQAIAALANEIIWVGKPRPAVVVRAAALCILHGKALAEPLARILWRGCESLPQRLKALLHTVLGVYFAALLQGRSVVHIHVHHGYFAAWVGMVAARLLNAGFSMTLHGSDLLLHRAYLDTKLENCRFCITVSEYNRSFLRTMFPQISASRILVLHPGVEVPRPANESANHQPGLHLLSVGRLHAVKDHAFLLRSLSAWKQRGGRFRLQIAGNGPLKTHLATLITRLGLGDRVELLGHVAHPRLEHLYEACDAVVLTSRSEGIPLVLMEAMARGKVVLAPCITGIPELVTDGKTGFLYTPRSRDDFLAKLDVIRQGRPNREIGRAARRCVFERFNRRKQVKTFAEFFLTQIASSGEVDYEDSLLQQIQLSV